MALTTVSFQIDSAHLARLVDAIAANHTYTGKDPNGANESKSAFARRMIMKYFRDEVALAEGRAAEVAARKSATDSANAIPIT